MFRVGHYWCHAGKTIIEVGIFIVRHTKCVLSKTSTRQGPLGDNIFLQYSSGKMIPKRTTDMVTGEGATIYLVEDTQIFKVQNTKIVQRCHCALLLRIGNTQLHWSDIRLNIFLFNTYPICYSAWNPAENECVDISQCLCLVFPKCWVARTTSSGCKENGTLCIYRGQSECPCLWEQRAPSLKPLLIRTWNLLLPWENFGATRRKNNNNKKTKTKTACGCLEVVGHVMQTPLDQRVGVETFNCADGRLKFLGLWRESQKRSELNCDSAAASNSRVHLSPNIKAGVNASL